MYSIVGLPMGGWSFGHMLHSGFNHCHHMGTNRQNQPEIWNDPVSNNLETQDGTDHEASKLALANQWMTSQWLCTSLRCTVSEWGTLMKSALLGTCILFSLCWPTLSRRLTLVTLSSQHNVWRQWIVTSWRHLGSWENAEGRVSSPDWRHIYRRAARTSFISLLSTATRN